MNITTIELMNEANKEVGFTGNVVEMAKVQQLLDKFAELVVLKCVDVSNEAEKQCQHPGTQIKKYFGVVV